ncbi:MAG: phosphonate metabolism transcriptional regulator PhnF [Rhodobacter sp.]|nr:phosphonate metabolism transcriptional regulator PhnF [Rhodobacter sp.]
MTRPALWTSIRDTLVKEIAQGHYGPGDRLPTEKQLSARFGVNRHTVRRALGELADKALVRSRRGAGVFVTDVPTTYTIGPRVRFHQNLRAAGQLPEKRIDFVDSRGADAAEANALGLAKGDPVHVAEGVALADDRPIALFRSVFPAARFPGMLGALQGLGSVTAAFREQGLSDYTRASTEIGAARATPTQAAQLGLRDGAPLLRTVGLNVDADNCPVEFGRTWFSGEVVTLRIQGADL